jgi:cytochrome c-type biogenesis protein CcmH
MSKPFVFGLLLTPGRAIVLVLLPLLLSALAMTVQAQVDTFQFDTIEQQQRFRQLSNELRCPQCQYSNLTGSTGGVAEDLRREIHRMIMEGMSNEEIEQFMYERYGDFIFFKPRLRTETILLWFGPLIFLLIGGLVAFSITRRARQAEKSGQELDPTQQARLNEILGRDQTSS